MSKRIKLYSFADVDRSGKVRWTACELGYTIEESRVELGQHRSAEYLSINPYAQIPAASLDGDQWIESSAICISLAERHTESGLIPADPGQRVKFWEYLHLASSTLEMPVVYYFLSSRGFANPAWPEIIGGELKSRLVTFAGVLPESGYLCGDFSIADICAGYVLRIAVQSDLLDFEGRLATYLDRLRARPAAVESRFFDSLES